MTPSPTVHRRLARRLALLALAWALLLGGCVAQAAEYREVMADDDLLAEASTDDMGAWQSAPMIRARWIPYPGRGTVKIFHGLGRTPTSVEVYISGDEDDRDERLPRNSYSGAGNLATISDLDDEMVELKNNTASSDAFYIRLVVR